MVLALVQLYFNDAWALTEVPSGNANGWDEIGSMRTSTSDPMLSSRTRYCSNATHSYAEGSYVYLSPRCEALLPGELVVKTPDSVFFTTAILETVTVGWPCDTSVASNQSASCDASSELYQRGNGQCECVSRRAIYPLAVEEMKMVFEHAFDTDMVGVHGNSVNQDGEGLWSDVLFPNGTSVAIQCRPSDRIVTG